MDSGKTRAERPTVSVVVPVYNVEPYLARCVDSLLAQTYRDFEILLVDDGSTDGSGALCDAYAARDPRVRALHKENGGLSSARNFGIENARGEFLCLFDGDDAFAPETLEVLHGNLVGHDADMSCCAFQYLPDGKTPSAPDVKRANVSVLTRNEASKDILTASRVEVSAANKLYRRAVFDTVRFPVGRLYEDAFVIADTVARCRKVVVTDAGLYFYYQRTGSITRSRFTERNLDLVAAHEYKYGRILEECPALRSDAFEALLRAHYMTLDRMLASGYRETGFRESVAFLQRHTLFALTRRRLHKKRRAALLGLWFGVGEYDRLRRKFRLHC